MTTEISPVEQWHKALGHLVEHLRLTNFPDVLIETLAKVAHFDTFLIATYKQDYLPVVLLSSWPEAEESSPIRRYLEEFYLLDPLFNAIRKQQASGLYRLMEIAPDSFEQTEYFQTCYSGLGLDDEIIFLCRLDNDVVFTISLGRTGRLGTITRAEKKRLKEIFPVISALCHQFWLALASEYVHDKAARSSLEQALQSFGSGVLTGREQEITGLILQGHSSRSIGETLEISTGTVKVHRKNIYARLNISAQSELFSQFLAHLSSL
ncbi:helix-turn-helix transcriptional regulator [Marinobacterium jannaschii]|uniref:helix-turn-helix transcriptional regulator n=1 Tax=Marinobacterium jannaschii TaxID=64970 RepID=UPI00048057B7|nr:helix-turn-helix transcriptional regulator [Marinobacterium jannaschii]